MREQRVTKRLVSLVLLCAALLGVQVSGMAEDSAAFYEKAQVEKTIVSAALEMVPELPLDGLREQAAFVWQEARHFTIPEDALSAPKPNAACYGAVTVDEAEKITEVIRQARDSGLLEPDEVTAFDPEATFYRGLHARNIEYYLDDTILVILWKENIEGMCCSFAEVKVRDASQFRRKLADDTYDSPNEYFASELGESVNAVVTMNADYYHPRKYGVVVWNRELMRFGMEYVINGCLQYNVVDTLFITSSGDFLYLNKGEETTAEAVNAFIQENDILFSLAFGPILVVDGEAVPCQWYPMGEVHEWYSRAGIGQIAERHYLHMSLNHGSQQARWTVDQFGSHFAEKPVRTAYCLDGGQTGEVYFCGSVYNYVDFNEERRVSDIIYFATAIPDGDAPDHAAEAPESGSEGAAP